MLEMEMTFSVPRGDCGTGLFMKNNRQKSEMTMWLIVFGLILFWAAQANVRIDMLQKEIIKLQNQP